MMQFVQVSAILCPDKQVMYSRSADICNRDTLLTSGVGMTLAEEKEGILLERTLTTESMVASTCRSACISDSSS